MQKLIILFALVATASLGQAQTQFNLVPNGDFDTAGGSDWVTDQSGGVWSFPATGGNADGYMEFSFTSPGSGWGGVGISPANNSAPFLSLISLGLAVGDVPIIQWDAKTDVLNTQAGVKIEAYDAAGNFISQASETPGSGYTLAISQPADTWATFQSTGGYTIPLLTDSIKVVAIYNQGFGALGNVDIGFDNVGVYGGDPVPEPSSFVLLGLGGLGLILRRHR